MMSGRFDPKRSFILLLTFDCLAFIANAQHVEEKAFLSDFNQTLIKKYARYEPFPTSLLSLISISFQVK